MNVPNGYENDVNITRFSNDKGRVNSFGHKLLDMYKSTGLRIVNGRIGEDRGIGNLTCITANGTSLVDYVLRDIQLFNIFCHFKVCDTNEFSDHCIVECSILSQMPRISTNRYCDVNTMKRKNDVWNNAKSEEFVQ